MKKIYLLFAALVCVISLDAKVLYLLPSAEWTEAGAKFSVHSWKWENDENIIADAFFTPVAGISGLYQVEVADDHTWCIFIRQDPKAEAPGFVNKWNQTDDLTIPTDARNLCMITGWADASWNLYANGVYYALNGAGCESVSSNSFPVVTRFGYAFTGWYGDDKCTQLVTELPANGTIYAGWEKIQGSKFYLTGTVNGVDNYDSEDALFVNGKLEMNITQNSYVVVKDEFGYWYMTDGWLGESVTEATLHTTPVGASNKLFVQGGKTYIFTLTYNGDTTYKLSYAEKTTSATAVENIQMEGVATKIIENGQIYILRDGARYNLLGAQVK